ncbi:thioredoxin domain-containing protein [Novosphingobium flavum]|uniref:Thioredoxin domain-containing protein n=1 Tax=Novosphingobium flavum TaxID=1778672 RepID=A0A7X1KLZ2_9SPHN|nr:thioredoxin domain-containing protein [Novosphingobium flavum]MBC2665833.1 thioredoxin domain-containing protein [Novosphingobium flavum]
MRFFYRPVAILTALFAMFTLFVVTAPAATPNWPATITVTPDGAHVMGNPKAKIRVTAWISYTCPHCAAFERESDAPLKIGYLAGGNVSLEIKHFLRDPVDATVAQLANCGPAAKFFGNHSAFLRGQAQWIQPMVNASAAQRQRWTTGDNASRRRAIASDFHLYEIMEKRGYARPELDRCLADETLARRIVAHTVEADKLGFEGTPAFALNGTPLFGTSTWLALEAQIKARL